MIATTLRGTAPGYRPLYSILRVGRMGLLPDPLPSGPHSGQHLLAQRLSKAINRIPALGAADVREDNGKRQIQSTNKL
jgi:hypothetical protein